MKNMKNLKRSILSMLLVIVIAISCYVPSFAANTQPSKYSTSSNSGQRNVVCTTLNGTSAASYYTGSYDFDLLSTQSASSIKSSLKTLVTNTHTKSSSYSDCKNKADQTDCENNSGKCVTIYTSYTTNYSGSITNREHVWPKSLGSPNLGESGPGSDLHHIRPSEINVNSNRSSLKYGEVTSSVKTSTGSTSGKQGGTYNSTYFEPLDNVKGDVARICLYMYVRYSNCSNITAVFQSVDVLLEWCEMDPVDTWEMGRNEVVAAYQGNRNVFIDYPEYAWLIFGKSVPTDMATPSGEASNGVLGGNGGNGGSTTPDTPTVPDTPVIPDTPETPDTPTDTTNYGTLEAPLTTTEVLNACKGLATGEMSINKFYVKGKVKSIGEYTTYYKNVTITDGSKDFLIYTVSVADGVEDFEVGDTVIANGYVKNYDGTIEMATGNGEYAYVVAVNPEIPDTPTCTHTNTEIKNAKAATCGAAGYTGDTYCKDCGTKVSSGTNISATGKHTWGTPVVTKDPTATTAGEAKYTCTVCSATQTESIPAGGEAPDEPATPDTPDTPDTPTTPDEPDTPDIPDTPDTPTTPEKDAEWGDSCTSEKEKVIMYLSWNALYSIVIELLTRA